MMALSLINNCPMKLSTDLELHPIQKMSKKGSGEGGGMGKCNKKLITTPYTPPRPQLQKRDVLILGRSG